MYVVRDLKSKEILHTNPAPASQGLSGQDVYFRFNPRTMEIGHTEGELPEHFNITKDGEIVAMSLQEQLDTGLLELEPEQKIEGADIVEKLLSEKVADGIVKLEPGQKVEDEQIVPMSLKEQLADGTISLDVAKEKKLEEFSMLSLSMRNKILPDYKIQNALLGLYDEDKLELYKSTIEAYRNEYRRLQKEVKKAGSIDALEEIKHLFPSELVGASTGKPPSKKVSSKKK